MLRGELYGAGKDLFLYQRADYMSIFTLYEFIELYMIYTVFYAVCQLKKIYKVSQVHQHFLKDFF